MDPTGSPVADVEDVEEMDSTTSGATKRIWMIVGAVIAVVSVAIAGYGSRQAASLGSDMHSSMTLIAPAAAGGGWDGVAREMQQAMKANGLVNIAQVVNQPGAGGTIALGNLMSLEGESNKVMVGGTGLVAATIQFASPHKLADATPLATVVEEYDVIVVPADSPYQTLEELMTAWKADTNIPWSGGGSFDQLVVADLALSAGIDPTEVNYISSDGGGEAIAALLNGTVQAAAGGYADNIDQIESGRLRALALVSAEPVDTIDIPTAAEQGFDVELTNWRILVAPPGISAEDTDALRELLLETIETPEWDSAIERYRWTEKVMYGEELDKFLADEQKRIEELYKEMGL